ncbi:uncharacterized protein PG998_010302 [Apiospora kogelbergensis]|uniref:uncharacterized protein n=1 Tax=Apiospora kogelbergensis TaxID=1337665 RepID=UPI0031302226
MSLHNFIAPHAAPSKPSHAIATQTSSYSKKSMSRDNVNKFMSTKNSGGDPVTALALRPGGSSKSSADRQAQVASEVEASLAQLNGTSS